MPGDDRTISFAMWPHLITMEGRAEALAAVLETLYADASLPRDQWSLAKSERVGRRAMALYLRAQGRVQRRVGLAALTRQVSDEIERRLRERGIKAFAVHLPTTGDA